jgi:hypothetical protein
MCRARGEDREADLIVAGNAVKSSMFAISLAATFAVQGTAGQPAKDSDLEQQ